MDDQWFPAFAAGADVGLEALPLPLQITAGAVNEPCGPQKSISHAKPLVTKSR
jgi:hypothetical protein